MRLSGRHIDCVRGGREVFSGLDFEASPGEALAVTGPNGSGKSSLLRLIAGLLVPAGGSVELEGGEAELTLPEQCPLSRPSRCAETGAERGGKPVVLAGFSRRRRPAIPRQCLKTVGLSHATQLPAAYLSAGQRRRLSIARLLAVRRPVWLLDEPTSALDTAGQDAVRRRDARPSRRRRHHHRRHAYSAWDRSEGTADAGTRHDRPCRADSPRYPNRPSRRRRRADRRAVFPHGRGADAVRDRARPGAADAARTRDSLARRAAWPACSRSTACSRPTTRTVRST